MSSYFSRYLFIVSMTGSLVMGGLGFWTYQNAKDILVQHAKTKALHQLEDTTTFIATYQKNRLTYQQDQITFFLRSHQLLQNEVDHVNGKIQPLVKDFSGIFEENDLPSRTLQGLVILSTPFPMSVKKWMIPSVKNSFNPDLLLSFEWSAYQEAFKKMLPFVIAVGKEGLQGFLHCFPLDGMWIVAIMSYESLQSLKKMAGANAFFLDVHLKPIGPMMSFSSEKLDSLMTFVQSKIPLMRNKRTFQKNFAIQNPIKGSVVIQKVGSFGFWIQWWDQSQFIKEMGFPTGWLLIFLVLSMLGFGIFFYIGVLFFLAQQESQMRPPPVPMVFPSLKPEKKEPIVSMPPVITAAVDEKAPEVPMQEKKSLLTEKTSSFDSSSVPQGLKIALKIGEKQTEWMSLFDLTKGLFTQEYDFDFLCCKITDPDHFISLSGAQLFEKLADYKGALWVYDKISMHGPMSVEKIKELVTCGVFYPHYLYCERTTAYGWKKIEHLLTVVTMDTPLVEKKSDVLEIDQKVQKVVDETLKIMLPAVIAQLTRAIQIKKTPTGETFSEVNHKKPQPPLVNEPMVVESKEEKKVSIDILPPVNEPMVVESKEEKKVSVDILPPVTLGVDKALLLKTLHKAPREFLAQKKESVIEGSGLNLNQNEKLALKEEVLFSIPVQKKDTPVASSQEALPPVMEKPVTPMPSSYVQTFDLFNKVKNAFQGDSKKAEPIEVLLKSNLV